MKEDSTCSIDDNARKPAVEKKISRMNESWLVAVLRRNDLNVTALVTHRLSISNEIMLPYRYVTHETVKLRINYSSYRGTRAGRFYRP